VALGSVLAIAAILMLRLPNFPRTVFLLQPLLVLLLLGAARASWRLLNERSA
jgi:FlaA1/EpsC-like NDP-sugar epimerase